MSAGDRALRWVLRALAWIASLLSVRVGTWIAEKAPVPPPGPPVVLPQTTAEDQIWITKAQEARLSQLQTVRTAAKDWASSIALVTGALGIVTLIKGPEEIGRLTKGWEVAVGIVLLAAVLLALRGIVLAALAAQGTPGSFRFSPASYRTHYLRQVRIAATQLRVSRIVVVLATLCVIAAVGMTWYGDEAEKTGTQVYAVSRDGTNTCGVVTVDKSGALLVKEKDKTQPTRFDPKDVLTLVPTGKCP